MNFLVYNNHSDILDAGSTYTPELFQLSFCSETLPNILADNCIQGFVEQFIFFQVFKEKKIKSMNSSAQYPVKVYHNYRQRQKSSS